MDEIEGTDLQPDARAPRPIAERVFIPSPITPWSCPECAAPASVGLRVGGLVNVRCTEHGTWYAQAPFCFTNQELSPVPLRPPRMDPMARSWFLHTATKAMLVAPARTFLAIEVQGHPCEYAILERVPGHELGLQLSCREWDCKQCGNQPLAQEAVAALSALGFDPPARHLNAWRERLPFTPRDLAALIERALTAAYEPPPDYEVALYASTPQDHARLVSTLW